MALKCNIYLTSPPPYFVHGDLTDQAGKFVVVGMSKVATMVAYDLIAMKRVIMTSPGSSYKY